MHSKKPKVKHHEIKSVWAICGFLGGPAQEKQPLGLHTLKAQAAVCNIHIYIYMYIYTYMHILTSMVLNNYQHHFQVYMLSIILYTAQR